MNNAHVGHEKEVAMDLQLMARRYAKYCDWCRRSGYAALDWPEYKQLRAAHYER